MSKQNKISKEHLKRLQSEQQAKATLIRDIGVVEAQKHELLHTLNNVMAKIKETTGELEKEYGKVNVNLEDGSYEAIEEEKPKDKE
tara:strand:- start:803 stop:1060 length:258 start_codon:yes stop_codon:yes gene_type:complete